MKTLTFFNEKGGVGKSLHTTLFASWLAYHEGARVAVLDMENPTPRLQRERDTELRLLEDPDSALSRYLARNPVGVEPYEIVTMSGGVPSYTKEYLEGLQRRAWDFVMSSIRKYDYVLFDFSGTLMEDSPVLHLVGSGLVDLTVVPFDVNAATRTSALITAAMFRRNEQRVVLFWNRVRPAVLAHEDLMKEGEMLFTSNGFEVLPERIKTFAKAEQGSVDKLFVCSSLCWPQRYVEMACPELPKLYTDLKLRLDAIH